MSKINRDFFEFISREDPTLGIFFQFLTGQEIVALGSTCRNASALMHNAEFEVTISLARMLEKPEPDIHFLPIEKCILDIPLIREIIAKIQYTNPSVWSRFRAFNIGTSNFKGQFDVNFGFTGEPFGTAIGQELIPLFENAKYIKSIRIGSREMLRSLRGFENKIRSAVIGQTVPAPPAEFLTSVPYEVDQGRLSWNASHRWVKNFDPDLLRFATFIRAITLYDRFQVINWFEHASKTAKIELNKSFFDQCQPEDLSRLIDVKRRFNVLLELEADNLVISPELEHAVDVYLDSEIALQQAVRYRTSLHKFKNLHRYTITGDNQTMIQQSLDMIVNLPPTVNTLCFDLNGQNMDFCAYEYSAEFEEACKRIKRIAFKPDLTIKIDLRRFLGFFPNLEILSHLSVFDFSLETIEKLYILPENPRFKLRNY